MRHPSVPWQIRARRASMHLQVTYECLLPPRLRLGSAPKGHLWAHVASQWPTLANPEASDTPVLRSIWVLTKSPARSPRSYSVKPGCYVRPRGGPTRSPRARGRTMAGVERVACVWDGRVTPEASWRQPCQQWALSLAVRVGPLRGGSRVGGTRFGGVDATVWVYSSLIPECLSFMSYRRLVGNTRSAVLLHELGPPRS